jgi:hypothetical protein
MRRGAATPMVWLSNPSKSAAAVQNHRVRFPIAVERFNPVPDGFQHRSTASPAAHRPPVPRSILLDTNSFSDSACVSPPSISIVNALRTRLQGRLPAPDRITAADGRHQHNRVAVHYPVRQVDPSLLPPPERGRLYIDQGCGLLCESSVPQSGIHGNAIGLTTLRRR